MLKNDLSSVENIQNIHHSKKKLDSENTIKSIEPIQKEQLISLNGN